FLICISSASCQWFDNTVNISTILDSSIDKTVIICVSDDGSLKINNKYISNPPDVHSTLDLFIKTHQIVSSHVMAHMRVHTVLWTSSITSSQSFETYYILSPLRSHSFVKEYNRF